MADIAPRVSIIILNWNGWKDTIECLESLYRVDYPNYDVIVVDNGSQDESVRKIKEYTKGKIKVNSKFFGYNPSNKPIKVFEVTEDEARQGKFNRPLYEKYDVDRRMILIKNKDNYGFTGGNNVGIKFALSVLNPDYVLLLNNDTVVDPKFLDELVNIAQKDEKIGVVGPTIYYYNAPQKVWSPVCWRSADTFKKEGSVKHTELYGACLLIRAELFDIAGLFDPNYFLYQDEIDLLYRFKRYCLLYATPNSRIWHKEDENEKDSQKPYQAYYRTRNNIYFLRKTNQKRELLKFLVLTTPITIIEYLSKARIDLLSSTIRGYADGLKGKTGPLKTKTVIKAGRDPR